MQMLNGCRSHMPAYVELLFFPLSATMQVYSHWKKRRGIVWSMADSFSWFLSDIIWEWRGVRAAAGMSASTWIFISLEKKIGHLSKAEPWLKEIRWWELSCISNGNMNKNTTVTCNGITSNIAWVQWVQVGKHGESKHLCHVLYVYNCGLATISLELTFCDSYTFRLPRFYALQCGSLTHNGQLLG